MSNQADAAIETYTVNTTDDTTPDDGTCTHPYVDADNDCTLHEAIDAANAHANDGGPDLIYFDGLTGGAPYVISLTAALPTITEAVVVDGHSGTQASCTNQTNPTVEIDGAALGPSILISMTGGGTTVRGLSITGNSGGTGIGSFTGSNYVVECNYVGADTTGSGFDPNEVGINLSTFNVTNSTISNNIITSESDGFGIYAFNGLNIMISENLIGLDVNLEQFDDGGLVDGVEIGIISPISGTISQNTVAYFSGYGISTGAGLYLDRNIIYEYPSLAEASSDGMGIVRSGLVAEIDSETVSINSVTVHSLAGSTKTLEIDFDLDLDFNSITEPSEIQFFASDGQGNVKNGEAKQYLGNLTDIMNADGQIETFNYTGSLIGNYISGVATGSLTIGETTTKGTAQISPAVLAINNPAPVLQSFTSTTVDDTYGPTSTVNVTATYDENLGAGSEMTVVLDNGVSVTLDTVDSATLAGTYTVGATGSGEDTTDLTVASITTESVFDTTLIAEQTESSVPVAPNNIADVSEIIIDVTAPQGTVSTSAQAYNLTDEMVVIVDYDEDMDPAMEPTFIFSVSHDSFVLFGAGAWNSATQYQRSFIFNGKKPTTSISISSSLGEDLVENVEANSVPATIEFRSRKGGGSKKPLTLTCEQMSPGNVALYKGAGCQNPEPINQINIYDPNDPLTIIDPEDIDDIDKIPPDLNCIDCIGYDPDDAIDPTGGLHGSPSVIPVPVFLEELFDNLYIVNPDGSKRFAYTNATLEEMLQIDLFKIMFEDSDGEIDWDYNDLILIWDRRKNEIRIRSVNASWHHQLWYQREGQDDTLLFEDTHMSVDKSIELDIHNQ